MSVSLQVRLVVSAAAAVAAGLTGVGGATAAQVHAPLGRRVNGTSANWSGYASTLGPFESVSASWVQPGGSCTNEQTFSSFWVGIDGDGSRSVEQTGSEVDCIGGQPVYYAWYEMYPRYPVYYTDLVRPGDKLNASVTTDGNGHFALTVSDTTQGWSHTQHKIYTHARRTSAEIIAEAPSSRTGVLPLTNFGKVAFTNVMANGQPIGNQAPEAISMGTGTTIKAVPSTLSGGTAFTDTWHES